MECENEGSVDRLRARSDNPSIIRLFNRMDEEIKSGINK